MGATKARFGIAALFCSLLIAGSVKGWFWYTQLTDRIYASIQQQVDFQLEAEQVQYDPVNKKITLKNVSLSAPGLDVETASLRLAIVAPGWRDIGRQTFSVTIERGNFSNTSLKADSPDSLSPLFDLGNMFFHRGSISFGKESPALSFSYLDFLHQPDTADVIINTTGAEGLSWRFEGLMHEDDQAISGKLAFNQQDAARFFSDSNYSGHFNAIFDLEWVGSKPLMLSGELQGEAGGYQSDHFSFFWEGMSLSGIELSDWRITGTKGSLILDEARLNLSDAHISPFLNWIVEHPLEFSGVEVADFLVKPNSELAKSFDVVDARLNLKDKKKEYHFTAKLASGGLLSLVGDIAGDYRITMKSVAPASLGMQETTRLYNFADRLYDFSYNSKSGIGRLSFWRQRREGDYSLLERLLFNADGLAELTFVDKAIGLQALKTTASKKMSDQLKAIHTMPFTYLSRLTDHTLLPYFEHISGESGLSLNGMVNLETFKRVCELRPGLNWQLETSFSDTEDWLGIARKELEQTLTDLLSADTNTSAGETREQLIEQLYLVTQKQKMPDVGLVTKEERIRQAEQWLIDSWPKNAGLIEQLQEGRKKELTARFKENGLSGVTILAEGQERDLPRSWLTIQ